MATETAKKAISTILQDKDFDLNCPRLKEGREFAHAMLDAISGDNIMPEIHSQGLPSSFTKS